MLRNNRSRMATRSSTFTKLAGVFALVWVSTLACNDLLGIAEPRDVLDAGVDASHDAGDSATAGGSSGGIGGQDAGLIAGRGGTTNESDASPAGGAAGASVAGASGSGPIPAPCWRSSESVTDSTTKISWTPLWYCVNDAQAPLFEAADGKVQIAYMETTESWFVCYRRGEPHLGSDIWYYTQGDKPTAGWEARNGWGYMPASNVEAPEHPFAGIVECSQNP